MRIIIIAAMSSNYVIGYKNSIPWFIKGELKRFRDITIDNNVVMGRKTFESIGKPLDKRNNIILSSNKFFTPSGTKTVSSFENALSACDSKKDTYIIGGSSIYELAMNVSNEMMLTLISKSFTGDTFFPKFNKSEWKLISETRNYDSVNKFCYSYLNYIR